MGQLGDRRGLDLAVDRGMARDQLQTRATRSSSSSATVSMDISSNSGPTNFYNLSISV